MPVRGTSTARHNKYVIIREQGNEGERIWCAWDECEQYGYYQYQFVVNEAKPGFAKKLARYVFCCEQHKQYFSRSHIPGQYGVLAGGADPRYR